MRVEIPEWNRYKEIKIPHSMSLSVSEILEYAPDYNLKPGFLLVVIVVNTSRWLM